MFLRYRLLKFVYIFMMFAVLLGSWHLTASAQTVNFPDANLAAAVRSKLGLAADEDITQTALQELTILGAILVRE